MSHLSPPAPAFHKSPLNRLRDSALTRRFFNLKEFWLTFPIIITTSVCGAELWHVPTAELKKPFKLSTSGTNTHAACGFLDEVICEH